MAPYTASSGFYSGSCYTATCVPYWTSGYTAASTTAVFPNYIESPKELKERLKREAIEEKERQERLANRTLADLDEDDKEELMTIINDFYKQYKREQEVKQLMSGIKWFLIFLGIAILFNFQRILALIELALK
jgi:hypothetical protein